VPDLWLSFHLFGRRDARIVDDTLRSGLRLGTLECLRGAVCKGTDVLLDSPFRSDCELPDQATVASCLEVSFGECVGVLFERWLVPKVVPLFGVSWGGGD
jgi:hypothetical protein